ncbi:G-D-S-L family lipolytic protein [Namhaeicola litoreus]|uniref:G-D-S-L family lipolytic protein n=1 Tax=Namhaeicola litoreus TaxID=1052145 RepID=A0ABW3XZE8_9FLAO
MSFKLKYTWLLLFLFAFVACDDDDDNPSDKKVALVPGSADFNTYVSLGNSLTAGFTDNALFIAAQNNSFPNILAEKFALVGGGEFTQPLTNDNVGGLLLGGNVISNPRLFFNGSGPQVLPGTPTTEVSNIQAGPYNNMGVPGAKSFHLLAPGYGNIAGLQQGLANPYFVRMASNPNTSVIADAMALNPTFFTLWVGNNDVLGYATTGGDGSNPITDDATFNGSISAIVTTLTSQGAKGVMANIPDVTTIPFFTTVPYNPLSPSNPDFAAQIPLLNQTFAQLNQAFAFLGVPERSVVYSETQASPVLIYDESLTDISAQLMQVLMAGGLDQQTAFLLSSQFGQSRQANQNDLLSLPSSSIIATVNTQYFQQLVGLGVPAQQAGQLAVNGVTYPLRDNWVLIPSEQEEVKNATDRFNNVIKSAADNAGLAFVDANTLLKQLSTSGIESGNYILTSDLVRGGAFSLDGVHLTARGYGLVANEMMKAIDKTYGSNFEEAGELVDVGEYPTNYNPALQ